MADQDWLIEDMRATITDLMALTRAQYDRLQDLQAVGSHHHQTTHLCS